MKMHTQRGFALRVAVFALVVVGVIITSGFYTVRQEGRIGTASENAELAFLLTEQGLVDLIGRWDASLFSSLAYWGDKVVTRNYPGLGQVTARVTKMTDLLYFVDAAGLVTKGGAMRSGASHRVGVTVRLLTSDIAPPVGGGLCPAPLQDKPGIMTDDASQVGTEGARLF